MITSAIAFGFAKTAIDFQSGVSVPMAWTREDLALGPKARTWSWRSRDTEKRTQWKAIPSRAPLRAARPHAPTGRWCRPAPPLAGPRLLAGSGPPRAWASAVLPGVAFAGER